LSELAQEEDIKLALESLPPSLYETYERILLRLLKKPKPTQDFVIRSLRWILFASEPLPLPSLCEAVAVLENDSDRRVPVAASDILKHCGSLIRKSVDENYLQSAHFSVKEFFSNITPSSHPQLAEFCSTEPHLELGVSCLTYLNLSKVCRPLPRDSQAFHDFSTCFPFYQHAAKSWIQYLLSYWDEPRVTQLTQPLFQPKKSSNFLIWSFVYLKEQLVEISQDLEDTFVDIYAELQCFSTYGLKPLHWAALLGVMPLVRSLTEGNEDIDKVACCGTALHAAILGKSSFYALVNDHYISSLLRISKYWSQTQRECVSILLQNGVNWKIPWSIQGHKLSTAELLLFTRDESVFLMSPLFEPFIDAACVQRLKHMLYDFQEELSEADVQFFSQLRPDLVFPDSREAFEHFKVALNASNNTIKRTWGFEGTLHSIAKGGQFDLLQQALCLAQADINTIDSESGMTVLQMAIRSGSAECVDLILQRGVDIHIKDKKGRNALHHSAKVLNADITAQIMSLQMNLSERDAKGQTASHKAAKAGNVAFLHQLQLIGSPAVLHLAVEDNNGYTPILNAAKRGYDDALLFLLEYWDGDINERNKLGSFLILVAAEFCTRETLENLILRGADVFVQSEKKGTIIHRLIRHHDGDKDILDTLNLLTEKGVDVSSADCYGMTPLHNLLLTFEPELFPESFERLVVATNVNARDEDGDTPLHCVWRSSYMNDHIPWKYRFTIRLLALGADPGIENSEGSTVLSLMFEDLFKLNEEEDEEEGYDHDTKNLLLIIDRAIEATSSEAALTKLVRNFRPLNIAITRSERLANKMLDHGVDPLLRDEEHRKHTAFETAASQGRVELLDKMTKLTLSAHELLIPAHFLLISACSNIKRNNISVIRWILSRGCEVDARNADGELALVAAVYNSETDVAKLLLAHGASPNKTGSSKGSQRSWNAIECAIFRGNLELLSIFAKMGVDWNQRMKSIGLDKVPFFLEGPQYIHVAANCSRYHSLSFLIDNDLTNYDAQSLNGLTPLHLACYSGDLSCVEKLLKSGANPVAQQDSGYTPLHILAAVNGNLEIVSAILPHSSLTAVTHDGLTAELLATRNGNTKLADFLRVAKSQAGMSY
jgi:ankyrin repeat protein